MNNKKQSNIVTRSCAGLMIAGIISMLMVVPAQAAPLGLTLNSTPDIFSSFINSTYDSTSGAFMATGDALKLFDGADNAISGGTFAITGMTISDLGVASGGLLTIGGTIGAPLSFGGGTLLAGFLTDFGTGASAGDPFEFLFEITSGDAAGLYGGVGSTVGVILDNTGYTGSFASDFSEKSFLGVADAGVPVPEPGTLGLMLGGLGMLAYYARRKRASA